MSRAWLQKRGIISLLVVTPLVAAFAFVLSGHREVRAKSPGPTTDTADNGKLVWFQGACDASGAVGIDSRRFLLADDEDNVLRVYDAERGGPPLFETDLSPELGLMGRKKGKEADLEGGARIGDTAFFLTSHGRKSDGRQDPNRLLFFATSIPQGADAPRMVGRPYRSLLDDLLRHPLLRDLDLAKSAEVAPKLPGGLNIEGLGEAPDGSLLLGFRSPVPNGRTLIVPLSNPRAVVDGQPPVLGAPRFLDLGGLGIRALSYFRGNHLIAAGSSGNGGRGKLYRWDGTNKVTPLEVNAPGFEALNPEALFTPEDRPEFLVLSDDGTRLVGSRPCKKLKNSADKRFRGMWVRPRGTD
jgi:hypothetical protein